MTRVRVPVWPRVASFYDKLGPKGARQVFNTRLHWAITRQSRWYIGIRPDWRGIKQPALTLGRLHLFWRRGAVKHTDAELHQLHDRYFRNQKVR